MHSICGLALRLRDLYKWQSGLAPWQEGESAAVLAWIEARETLWEALEGAAFSALRIDGRRVAPFRSRAVNEALEPLGLFYGAGYAQGLRPTFFLAPIEEHRQEHGHRVLLLGRELARDLLTLPALVQDACVVVRRQAAALHVWDNIAYVRPSGRRALAAALGHCAIAGFEPAALRHGFARLLADRERSCIDHEIGELADRTIDADAWREVIAAHPHSPVELLARAVKDLLADTHPLGTLRQIAAGRRIASLGFFVAFAGPLTRALTPEVETAFSELSATGRWQALDQALAMVRRRAERYARCLLALHRAGRRRGDPQWTRRRIEQRLLAGLGITLPDQPDQKDGVARDGTQNQDNF